MAVYRGRSTWSLDDMAVAYAIRISEDYVVEALARHRSCQKSRWFRRPVKILCGVGLVALAAVCLYARLVLLAVFFAFLIVLLLMGPRLDYFIVRWRWRRAPQNNAELKVEVSEQHLASSDQNSSATANWPAYNRAVEFSSGVLLYTAPWHYLWLPDIAIVAGLPEDARSIYRANIRDYHVV
jgi:hypothetical protein